MKLNKRHYFDRYIIIVHYPEQNLRQPSLTGRFPVTNP
jgi:hypothetical protein